MSYDPSIGEWLEQDPAGYIDGPNRSQLEKSNPVDNDDPSGLDTAPILGANPIGTLKGGSNQGAPVYSGIDPSDGSANGTWWYQNPEDGNTWEQADPNNIQSQPRQAYLPPAQQPSPQQPPCPATSTITQTAPDPVIDSRLAADDELQQLQIAAARYAMNDTMYWPLTHDCVDQSQGLNDRLNLMNPKYWVVRTEQRHTASGAYHNVVVLDPVKGNPLPPMVLDTWHVGGPRTAILEPYSRFKQDYPLPG